MWWSRPLPWAIGVRPNSPPQTTSVSSSMPRCFRSVISAADAPVDLLGLELDVVLDAAVVVPVAVVELDEAHAALGQPAGQQAVGGERAVARLGAVHVEHCRRLVREVHQAGHAGLHLERHLVLADARGDLGIVHRRVAAMRLSACTASTTSRCCSAFTPAGLLR